MNKWQKFCCGSRVCYSNGSLSCKLRAAHPRPRSHSRKILAERHTDGGVVVDQFVAAVTLPIKFTRITMIYNENLRNMSHRYNDCSTHRAGSTIKSILHPGAHLRRMDMLLDFPNVVVHPLSDNIHLRTISVSGKTSSVSRYRCSPTGRGSAIASLSDFLLSEYVSQSTIVPMRFLYELTSSGSGSGRWMMVSDSLTSRFSEAFNWKVGLMIKLMQ